MADTLPIFIVNGHDYTKYIAAEGLKPSRNDLDKDGSGRNILNGLMYRIKITTKLKYSVSFLRLTADVLRQLENDMDTLDGYVNITLLEAKSGRQVTRTYYTSTINEGVQRAINGEVFYDGVTFDITER